MEYLHKKTQVNCKVCGKVWEKRKDTIKSWNGRCRNCAQQISCNTPEMKEIRRKTGMAILHHKGESHYAWKGDKVGYRALHSWIERKLGKPNFCEDCRNGKLNSRRYNWANISGKYLRNINDWRRLCVKCHKAFDKKRA